MTIFELADLIGTIAFALSGFFMGVRKKLDIMGIFILAMLTATGGGAVRDVLVGKIPNVLQDIYPFYVVTGSLLLGYVIHLRKPKNVEENFLFVLSDSIGLAAFALTGTLVGMAAELNVFGVMVLAFMTATGGGIIRDILVNRVPNILRSDFYGSVAILMGFSIFMLREFGLNNEITISLVFFAGLTLRLVAYKKNWELPKIGPQ